MRRYHTARTKLSVSLLMCLCLIPSLAGQHAYALTTSRAGSHPPIDRSANFPVGADLTYEDSSTQQYTKLANNQTELRLYNSPVGVPDESGWRFRDLHLSPLTSTGADASPGLGFGLHIAASSSSPTLALLTSEDKVTLGIGLTSVDGATPAAVSGAASDNSSAITYAGIVPAIAALATSTPTTATVAQTPTASQAAGAVDLSLRPTISGLDLRLVLHNPSQGHTFVLALSPDPRTQLVQDAAGTIRLVRPIADYADDGTYVGVTKQAEYLIDTPSAFDSGTDLASTVQPGPTTMVLAPATSGMRYLAISVNPSWLQDPRRVFPVRVDLPINTMLSTMHTGWFGTVNSCASQAPAPLAQVVVGVADGCTYRGQLYFPTTSLQAGTPILSASLHLYTPAQTSSTGISLYPNWVPSAASMRQKALAALPLTLRQLAPAVSPNLQPPSEAQRLAMRKALAQDVATGNLPNLPDATSLPSLYPTAYQHPMSWQRPTWNNAPPVAAGMTGIVQSASAGHWQSWDVTNLLNQWVQDPTTNNGLALESTGSAVVLASALDLAANDPSTAPYLDITFGKPVPQSDPGAYDINGFAQGMFADGCIGVCGGNPGTFMAAVNNAFYVRFQAKLNCSGSGVPGDPDPSVTENQLQDANTYSIIPIVDIIPNSKCLIQNYSWWINETEALASYLTYNMGFPNSTNFKMVYFEIGNEENFQASPYQVNGENWPTAFWYSAVTIYSYMPGNSNYRVVTGGMLQPTNSINLGFYTYVCPDSWQGFPNISIAWLGLFYAEMFMPTAYLAAGAHPYGYNTDEVDSNGNFKYFKNFYDHTQYGTESWSGICRDLGFVTNTWVTGFPNILTVFTEDNWNDQPTNAANCPYSSGGQALINGCEGTYLVDMLTWMADHNSYSYYPTSPLRIMFMSLVDFQQATPILSGVYSPSSASPGYYDKPITVKICPDNSGIQGHVQNISYDYYNLALGGFCY